MTMVRLPVDDAWIVRLLELADAWTLEGIAATFLRYGWVEADPDGPSATPLTAIPSDDEDSVLLPEGWVRVPFGYDALHLDRSWQLFLGEYPPPGQPGAPAAQAEPADDASALWLTFALFNPANGAEDERPRAERCCTADFEECADGAESDWILDDTAGRDRWWADFDRVAALVRARAGEPDRVVPAAGQEPSKDGRRALIWDRGPMSLVLRSAPYFDAYFTRDHLALVVCPTGAAESLDGR